MCLNATIDTEFLKAKNTLQTSNFPYATTLPDQFTNPRGNARFCRNGNILPFRIQTLRSFPEKPFRLGPKLKILSYNPGHDGAIAFIQDSRLMFSIEAEKDSNYRYSSISVVEVLDAVGELEVIPDVICMSGWWPRDHHEFLHGSHTNGGYRGLSSASAIMDKGRLLRGKADYFSSSHERSHILCAFGMSNLPKGTACYALVWEGEMGAFYEIDSELNITLIADVLNQPGNRYGPVTV